MCSEDDPVLLITGGYDHTVKLWQAHSGMCTRTIQYSDCQVNGLEISHDKKMVAAAGYQHVKMFDLTTNNNNPIITYDGIQKNVTAVGFNSDGSWMYTVGEDGFARIWDNREHKQSCHKAFKIDVPINCASLHPNGTVLFVGDQNGTLHLWDLKTNDNEQIIPEQDCSIQSLNIASNGKSVAAVTNKGVLFIWSISGENCLKLEPFFKKKVHDRYALKCLYSADCKYLATTSADSTIKIWNTEDMSSTKVLKTDASQRWVWDCAFTSDSQYIISVSSDNLARLWEIESGQIKRQYAGHQKPIVCLAFRDQIMMS